MQLKKLSKTAEHILQQATAMFAEQGYNGTIMDNLAKQADVNKASIYYHFGDKAELYNQCMTRLFKKVVDRVIDQVEQTRGSQQKLETLIAAFAKEADSNRNMPALLMREFASGGINMPVNARQQMQRTLAKLKEILQQGEEEGVFHHSDPFSAHIMIIGSICLFITSQPMREAIKTPTKLDPELDDAIKGITRLLLNGLQQPEVN